jgi:pyruvate dehydrogenase E1 component beta subunit
MIEQVDAEIGRVHRALEAAERVDASCEVIDLRSLRPLDTATVVESVRKTGRLLVVDEDYREYGLSGELAAVALEAGLTPRFGRVCVEETLPYARSLELAALPNAGRIRAAIDALVA